MKVLLKEDVEKLGLVGDVVDVAAGYARNYLIPHGVGVEPTKANLKAIEELKRQAAEHRRLKFEALQREAQRLADVEVTIPAAANEEGILYGSVGAREIASALREEGHSVQPEHVRLAHPIKQLDNVTVEIHLAENVEAQVKVWVVREKSEAPVERVAGTQGSEAE